jgi:hypothetical protein
LLNESPLFVFVTKRNERVFDGPYNGQAKTVASLTYCLLSPIRVTRMLINLIEC